MALFDLEQGGQAYPYLERVYTIPFDRDCWKLLGEGSWILESRRAENDKDL